MQRQFIGLHFNFLNTEPLAKPSNPKYPHELLAYSEAIFNLKAVTTAVFLS
jgi:hypothetical protein